MLLESVNGGMVLASFPVLVAKCIFSKRELIFQPSVSTVLECCSCVIAKVHLHRFKCNYKS